VLETSLRALSPFMPFITEELWQRLPRPANAKDTIMIATYPTIADGPRSAEAERDMSILMGAVSAARSTRSEHDLPRQAKVPLELRAADPAVRALLERESRYIELLVNSDGAPKIAAPSPERPRGSLVSVAGDVEVLVGLRGLVEPKKEEERLSRQLKKTEKDIKVLEGRLANKNFVDNAPPEVVSESKALLEQMKRQYQRIQEAQAMVHELE
jgi:valyl-tRNA synthetase